MRSITSRERAVSDNQFMSNVTVNARPVIHNTSVDAVTETAPAEAAAKEESTPATTEKPSTAALVAIGLGASAPKNASASQSEKLMLLGAQFASRS
jgi:hypothetical protein